MIHRRSDLHFFMITKRPERILQCLPEDWGDGYENVTICCTMENQRRVDERLPIYRELPIRHKSIICEPLLESIDFHGGLGSWCEQVTVGGSQALKPASVIMLGFLVFVSNASLLTLITTLTKRNHLTMLRDFIAIDFETANQEPSSVCSVGVVMVRDGQKVDSFYSLIQPEPNYYNYWCQRVHGISQDDTEDAPVFSKVWQQLEERIVDVYFADQELDDVRYQIATLPLVAHNARFDEGCLKAVFEVYQMDYPDYRFYDTLTASRRQFGHSLPNHQLQTVAAACGYDLQNHHHALADAEACAAIALYLL